MIHNIKIENFRAFKNIQVKRLNKVNLIVGKNSSGKSCFLEALQVYFSKANPLVLHKLVSSRSEFWKESQFDINLALSKQESAFRHLFWGYHFPDNDTGAIKIGSLIDDNQTIKITHRLYETLIYDSGRKQQVPIPESEIGKLDLYSDVDFALELEIDQKKQFLMSLSDDSKNNRIQSVSNSANLNIVSTDGLSEDEISTYWDNINLTDLEDEVVKCLQLIDGNIKKLALVNYTPNKLNGSEPTIKRIPIISYSNNERLPLKSMGDGVLRLFHIILALVNAKDGYLLIDEIDNGLHWSVHPQLWEIIFKLADRLNIQVFASSHNKDAVSAFEKIWDKNPNLGSFVRMERKGTDVKAKEYTLELLRDSIESEVEVR